MFIYLKYKLLNYYKYYNIFLFDLIKFFYIKFNIPNVLKYNIYFILNKELFILKNFNNNSMCYRSKCGFSNVKVRNQKGSGLARLGSKSSSLLKGNYKITKINFKNDKFKLKKFLWKKVFLTLFFIKKNNFNFSYVYSFNDFCLFLNKPLLLFYKNILIFFKYYILSYSNIFNIKFLINKNLLSINCYDILNNDIFIVII